MSKGLDFTYPLLKPGRNDYKIGIIGAGGIVSYCHMPAYRKAGFNVVAITAKEYAQEVAGSFKIPHVCKDYKELIGRDDIDVIDIALPPHLNFGVIEYAISKKKHILCQKPLALSFNDAKSIAEMVNAADIKFAVNQNGRWDPAIRLSKRLIKEGYIGKPVIANIELRVKIPWQKYLENPLYDKLELLHMGIHHIDQYRMLFGEPTLVCASKAGFGEDRYYGEMITTYSLEYVDGLLASCLDDSFTWTDDYGINYRFEGTEGVLKGTIGWPEAFMLGVSVPSTISLYSRKLDNVWYHPVIKEKWFPDAFINTMGDLLCSIEEDREPEANVNDNLETLRIVFAAYKSIEEGRKISPGEVN